MEFHIPLEFSIHTLTGTTVLPLLYYAYQTKFWYRPDILKRCDMLLITLAAITLFLTGIKLVELHDQPWLRIQSGALHLIGPLLCILIIRKTKLERWFLKQANNEQNSSTEDIPKTTYKPTPAKGGVDLISWNDIVINEDLKQELLATIQLLKNPKEAQKYGIEAPKGMLFYGPPGTGKTTIARVMAGTAGLNFFALKLDDVVSKWVGESEKNLSALFAAATKHAPSVIFIDEIDAIGRARGDKSQAWSENLLNHLLQLIDGVVKSEGVYVIGATNRVELVDSALKRAGRLNKAIEIPNPDYEARLQLFHLYLSRLQLHSGVDIHQLATFTDGCSGADIKEICNQAGLNAFKRESQQGEVRQYQVTLGDLSLALQDFSKPNPLAA